MNHSDNFTLPIHIKHIHIADIIIPLVIFATLFLSIYHINEPYSYWFDELYSVSVGLTSFSDMMSLAFHDVHPPLYQILLWLWLRIVNDHEFSTRILSFIFAFLSWFIFISLVRMLPRRAGLIASVLFFTSWTIPYYAQECRGYSLLLFLTTLVLYFFLKNDNDTHSRWLILSSVLLGLTHFFGVLLAALILCWLGFERRNDRKLLISIGIAFVCILAWPIGQFTFGSSVRESLGGNFWITSNGPLDTLHKAVGLFALTEHHPTYTNWRGFLAAGFGMFILLFYIYAVGRKGALFATSLDIRIFQKLSFLLGGVLFAVILLDLHTPVSTTRNFIVLLPVTSMVLGIAVSSIARGRFSQPVSVVMVLVFGALSLNASYHRMNAKSDSLENWRAAAETITMMARTQDVGWRVFYLQPGEEWREDYALMARYYVHRFQPDLQMQPVIEKNISQLTKPFILFLGHIFGNERERILKHVQASHPACEFFSPQQRWTGAVVVVSCRG